MGGFSGKSGIVVLLFNGILSKYMQTVSETGWKKADTYVKE